MLHKDKVMKNFKKVHDIISKKLCFELNGSPLHRFFHESQKLIQSYGSIYSQYPKFTYLRIGGFDDESMQLSRYAFDYFILVEVSRQLVVVINKFFLLKKHNTLSSHLN